MKNSDWFVCLSYGKYNFLFPHDKVLTQTELVEKSFEGAAEIDFDEIFFNERIPAGEKKSSVFFLGEQKILIHTSVLPSVSFRDMKNFFPPQGALEKLWQNLGVQEVSFCDGNFMLLVDPEILFKWWSKEK